MKGSYVIEKNHLDSHRCTEEYPVLNLQMRLEPKREDDESKGRHGVMRSKGLT